VYLLCFIPFLFQFQYFESSNNDILNSFDFTTKNNLYLYNIFDLSFFQLNRLNNRLDDESILSRAENIFFLLLPVLYFYISNIVKLYHFLSYGVMTDSFNTLENRFIWVSIISISFNIIIHDIFY